MLFNCALCSFHFFFACLLALFARSGAKRLFFFIFGGAVRWLLLCLQHFNILLFFAFRSIFYYSLLLFALWYVEWLTYRWMDGNFSTLFEFVRSPLVCRVNDHVLNCSTAYKANNYSEKYTKCLHHVIIKKKSTTVSLYA